jgi:hypothetical protein
MDTLLLSLKITATRGASDSVNSSIRDARSKDERDNGDSGRCGPGKRRWGRTIAKTTGRDHMSVDDDSEREFVVVSIMAPVGSRYDRPLHPTKVVDAAHCVRDWRG